VRTSPAVAIRQSVEGRDIASSKVKGGLRKTVMGNPAGGDVGKRLGGKMFHAVATREGEGETDSCLTPRGKTRLKVMRWKRKWEKEALGRTLLGQGSRVGLGEEPRDALPYTRGWN